MPFHGPADSVIGSDPTRKTSHLQATLPLLSPTFMFPPLSAFHNLCGHAITLQGMASLLSLYLCILAACQRKLLTQFSKERPAMDVGFGNLELQSHAMYRGLSVIHTGSLHGLWHLFWLPWPAEPSSLWSTRCTSSAAQHRQGAGVAASPKPAAAS